MLKKLILFSMLLVVSGCAAATKTVETVSRDSKVAIIEFTDCGQESSGLGKNNASNCEGSGKVTSKIYSEIFNNAPIFESEKDPAVKNFDLLISGKVVNYNIGTPFVGRINYAAMDLVVKRLDGKIVATQQEDNNASPTYGKKTPELVKEFAEDLKRNLGIQ